ncbi:hypothetical protein M2103_001698 [Ereboglobus sp. PH5-5]|uniref:hypothetical protein n=1 Tax=Ereboglobus sp. PH5-5 TaxID=2940529 RepID=UPI002406E807|nr:hypothetical protein [Ereboglobus sp. PH5-5]MDF9833474.1 hypothetical protein [Ereboglobus sp. PH5-5]
MTKIKKSRIFPFPLLMFLLASLLLAIILSLWLIAHWHSGNVNWCRDIHNQTFIADAYVKYYEKNGKLAASLHDLVSEKLLPPHSYIYKEPPGFSFGRNKFNYIDSSYVIMPVDVNDIERANILGRKENERIVYEAIIHKSIYDRIIKINRAGLAEDDMEGKRAERGE